MHARKRACVCVQRVQMFACVVTLVVVVCGKEGVCGGEVSLKGRSVL